MIMCHGQNMIYEGMVIPLSLGIPPYKEYISPCTGGMTIPQYCSFRFELVISHHTWLVVEPHPSEKYEFVSWDDDIPNIWENNPFMFQTTNQQIIFRWTSHETWNPNASMYSLTFTSLTHGHHGPLLLPGPHPNTNRAPVSLKFSPLMNSPKTMLGTLRWAAVPLRNHGFWGSVSCFNIRRNIQKHWDKMQMSRIMAFILQRTA